MRAGLAEQTEYQRDCHIRDLVEHFRPADVGQRRVELGARGCGHRCAQRVGQHLQCLGIHGSLLPEVKQPAGDDVSLNLGGAAIDGRRARIQILGAPRRVF
jgi:hypothetical protein